MVNKRGGGVKRGEDNQRVGCHFMDFLHRAGQRAIAGPWRNDFGQTEQRERIANCSTIPETGTATSSA